MPTIDILLPTYKPNETFLIEALESLKAQTHTDWHLYISDEPTDVDTASIIQKVLDENQYTFVKNDEQLGIGGNWNKCLKNGEAPYIQFLFQDDVWAADFLARGIEILENNSSVGFVSMQHEYMFEGEMETQEIYENLLQYIRRNVQEGLHNGKKFLDWWLEESLDPNVIGEPSFVMFRRSAVEKVGDFHEDMSQNLDIEYWVRMLLETDWYYLPGAFGSFRVHPESASQYNYLEGKGHLDRFRILEMLAGKVDKSEESQIRTHQKVLMSRMIEKFVKRYAGKEIEIPNPKKPEGFLLSHPFLLFKAWRGYKRHTKNLKS